MDKTEIKALPPQLRSFALVGWYLGTFAFVELALDNALAALLHLNSVSRFILGRNMSFIDKARSLRTLANHAFSEANTSAQIYDDLCKDLQRFAEDRNIIAHTVFSPSETSDGVQFYVVEAKGHFRLPIRDLSVDEFDEKVRKLQHTADELDGPSSIERLKAANRALRLDGPTLALVNALLKDDDGLGEL